MSSTDRIDRPASDRHAPDRPARGLPTAGLERFGAPRIIATAVVVALAVNLVLWLAGVAAGGDFEFTDGDEVASAAPGGVVFLTVVPLAVGMALAALLARRWPALVRVAQVVGSVLALGTIAATIATDFDGASTVALSLTHVTLVPVLLVGLEAIRLRVPAR